MDEKKLQAAFEALKAASDYSAILTGWALAIFGGSVAAIVSTSSFRPATPQHRAFYLLLFVGWVALGVSVYLGQGVRKGYLALHFAATNAEFVKTVKTNANTDISNQLTWLYVALFAFSIWLTCFLVWWIFAKRHK